MLVWWLLGGLVAAASVEPASCELFTASSELQSAFSLERDVASVISRFITLTEKKLSKLKNYLREYSEVENDLHHNDGDNFMEKIAGNPVHAFHLAKRFAVDWRRIQNTMRKDQWPDVSKQIESLKLGTRLPKESDMLGVAKALVRLHDTYNIDLDRLASGDMLGVQTSATLTAQDCMYMGKHSLKQRMYFRAVEWFDTALKLAESEQNGTVAHEDIVRFSARARIAHDEVALTPNHTNMYVLSEPLNGRSPAEVRGSDLETGRVRFQLGTNISTEQDFLNYNALCRGEQLLLPKETAKLKCWNSDRGFAYFKLRPIKVEQKHIDPDLYMFHDVISDEEIEFLKETANVELSRSLVIGGSTGDKVSDTRISKTAWLDDTRHATIAALSRRVAAITALSTDIRRGEAEMFQIVNYGIGGHYNYHEDYLYRAETLANFVNTYDYVKSGDRIATFMFYLSDVTRGGATAFPKLGVAVFPERGAASFWHNLRRSGRGDLRTLHGGCPVAYGSKWIANKWIRERNQFLRRPCALDRAQ